MYSILYRMNLNIIFGIEMTKLWHRKLVLKIIIFMIILRQWGLTVLSSIDGTSVALGHVKVKWPTVY